MEHRGFHLSISPLGDFVFFGYGAVAISTKEVSKGYAKPLTS